MNTLKTINIFRSGTHTAMGGQTLTYSEQDVSRMAAVYNEAARPAPLVLGHPQHDDPAYGVVKSLFARAGVLYAIASVSTALVDLVKAGRYSNISASFVAPTGPGNPAPGAWYLRHVGFLGAMAPAVKGLDALAFAEGAPVCFGSSGVFSFAQASGTVPDAGSDRQSFHEAAQTLMKRTPGMTYAAAAIEIDRGATAREVMNSRFFTKDPDRAAQHGAVLNFQESIPGMTYGEALARLQAAGMVL
jgi:hypothetical protein